MTKQNLFKLGAKAMRTMRKPFFQTNFAKFFAAIAALVLLNARPEIMAQDTEMTRATLKGLPGVYVLVEDFTEQNKAAGFDERIFQTDASKLTWN